MDMADKVLGHGTTGPVTPAHVNKAVKVGATLQVFQPHRFHPRLLQLVAELEEEFGALVGTNVYITPSGSQVRR